MTTDRTDTVIIGAGPYGLAAAAELRRSGLGARVFGEPMSFWEKNMPKGMFLRSPWAGSHIGGPKGVSLDEYERARGSRISRPVPLSDFVAYGHHFRERAVPEIESRRVMTVTPRDGGFRLALDDGELVDAARVVVAAGISPFAWRPPEFNGLPQDLASHSSDHTDLGRFAGRRVVVVGGGQSALESAALLRESGADVEVILRGPRLRWVGRAPRSGLLGHLLFHHTDVGPAGLSQLVARPALLRSLPKAIQQRALRRSIVAGAALWLRPRLVDLPITNGRHVVQATRSNGHLQLRLDDGAKRDIDHVLLATGYRVDIRRYAFLGREVQNGVRSANGYPLLDGGFQSTVPGLYFLGATASHSFGPLVRFVAGTEYAARSLTRSLLRPKRTRSDRAERVSGIRTAERETS